MRAPFLRQRGGLGSQGGAAFGLLGLGGGLEDTGGVEVFDLELFDGCRAHGSIQAVATDIAWSRIPLFHRDSQRISPGFEARR